MNLTLAALVRRLEFAQARQSRAFLDLTRTRNPEARALRGSWGFAHHFGPGHFLNQALALGLGTPCSDRQLDRLEALLGQGGHPVVLELTPAADPELAGRLARRGYRIQAFQLVMHRARLDLPTQAPGSCRIIGSSEEGLWARLVQAGFQETDDLEAVDPAFTLSGFGVGAEGNTLVLAEVRGESAGAGVLGCFGRTAVLSGTSVLPRFRGRGLQRDLILDRLTQARLQGCCEACAAVLPGSASQANLERCGFRVAYPKLELVRD